MEVRLDAVAAVVLDGLSYRRAGRAVGISKTEVGDLDLLLGPLAALGYCQPDGSFITSLAELRAHLAKMARTGEALCLDGLGARVQRPRGRPLWRLHPLWLVVVLPWLLLVGVVRMAITRRELQVEVRQQRAVSLYRQLSGKDRLSPGRSWGGSTSS